MRDCTELLYKSEFVVLHAYANDMSIPLIKVTIKLLATGKSKSENVIRKISTGASVENVQKILTIQNSSATQEGQSRGSRIDGAISTGQSASPISSPTESIETVKKITLVEEGQDPEKASDGNGVNSSTMTAINTSLDKSTDGGLVENVVPLLKETLEGREDINEGNSLPSAIPNNTQPDVSPTSSGDVDKSPTQENSSKEGCRPQVEGLYKIVGLPE